MLPVCSATTVCSTHSQISLRGGLRVLTPFSSNRKLFEIKCILEDRTILGLSNGTHLQGISFKPQAATSSCSNFFVSTAQSSLEFVKMSPHQNELDDNKCGCSYDWDFAMGEINKPHSMGVGHLQFVDSRIAPPGEEELTNLTDQLNENINSVPKPVDPQSITTFDIVPDVPILASDSLDANNEAFSGKTSIVDLFAEINGSISASVDKGEKALRTSLDAVTSSITSALKGANDVVDDTLSKVVSAIDQTGDTAGNRLTGFSNDLKGGSSRVGIVAVDLLRRTIITVEDSFAQGASFVVYAYGSAKELLPPEVQDVLNSSEERAIELLRPVGSTFQQIYITLEELERSLGLDPTDPVISFILLLGTSAAFWGCYRILTYGGYAGNLSPEVTLELLRGKESVVLVDVRPEDLRERDGIPDLRRSARFRYAYVSLPEVDSSVRKLLRGGRELDDFLVAAVIRNLNNVKDRSKVIVMDADGTRSKGIARSLRKLGVKGPYLVQGGFRSWAKEGLRIKELRPETTLTILNEEAEAILEDIRPTPSKVIGYGVGLFAAGYALLEWEKTLQLIGVVGLAQTIYWRVASYEDSEDFREDVSALLTPVRLGGQAISWAAGKLETNGVGLPTSPSSSDVQSRVLQAAAKHESQPSDEDENQDLSSELAAPESGDLSDA